MNIPSFLKRKCWRTLPRLAATVLLRSTGANGMMIPLPKTHEDARKTGDPRLSLEELYGDHTGYVRAVANAALNLWAQRLMLLEDVFQTIQEADESDVLR